MIRFWWSSVARKTTLAMLWSAMNFSRALLCGLLSTVIRVLVPKFVVGVEEST